MSIFSCKDAVRLASLALDRSLPPWRRLALRVHLLMCSHCARWRPNLLFVRDAARRFEDQAAEGYREQAGFSSEARARIKRALEQANS